MEVRRNRQRDGEARKVVGKPGEHIITAAERRVLKEGE